MYKYMKHETYADAVSDELIILMNWNHFTAFNFSINKNVNCLLIIQFNLFSFFHILLWANPKMQ